MTHALCKLEGCDRPHHARGLCHKHYWLWSKWGDPEYKSRAGNHEHVGCKVPGCERPHKALGYCQAHYQRLKRTGTLADSYGLIDID